MACLTLVGGGVVGRKRTRPSPLRGLCVLMPRLTWAAVSACLSRPDTPRRGLPAAAAPAVRLPPDRTDPVLVLFSFKGGRRRDYCGQKCAKQKCLDYDRDGEGGVGLASMSSTDGSDPMGGCGGFGALTDVFGMCRQCPPSAGGGGDRQAVATAATLQGRDSSGGGASRRLAAARVVRHSGRGGAEIFLSEALRLSVVSKFTNRNLLATYVQ